MRKRRTPPRGLDESHDPPELRPLSTFLDERAAWDAFALEAIRQLLYMAPESLNWSDKMADAPQLFADRVAEVADRMLEKRRARFK